MGLKTLIGLGSGMSFFTSFFGFGYMVLSFFNIYDNMLVWHKYGVLSLIMFLLGLMCLVPLLIDEINNRNKPRGSQLDVGSGGEGLWT